MVFGNVAIYTINGWLYKALNKYFTIHNCVTIVLPFSSFQDLLGHHSNVYSITFYFINFQFSKYLIVCTQTPVYTYTHIHSNYIFI